LTLPQLFDTLLINFLPFYAVGMRSFRLSRQERLTRGLEGMQKRLKKLVIWAVILACGYFILSIHFIFIGSSIQLLKKSRLTLEYTFFSTQGKSAESIMNVDALREDGIGRLLVEKGIITEDQHIAILEKYR
jgi:hypothetical protein